MGDGLFAPSHLLLLAIVAAILFFGWKQLPDMSRSLGRSLRILKTEIKGMTDDDKARAESVAPAQIEPAPTQQPQAAVPIAKAPPLAQPVARPSAPAASSTGARPRPAPRPGHRPTPASARSATSAGSDR